MSAISLRTCRNTEPLSLLEGVGRVKPKRALSSRAKHCDRHYRSQCTVEGPAFAGAIKAGCPTQRAFRWVGYHGMKLHLHIFYVSSDIPDVAVVVLYGAAAVTVGLI